MENNKSERKRKTTQRKKKELSSGNDASQENFSARKKTSSKGKKDAKKSPIRKEQLSSMKESKPAMTKRAESIKGKSSKNAAPINKSANQPTEITGQDLDSKENTKSDGTIIIDSNLDVVDQVSSQKVMSSIPAESLYGQETLFLKEQHKAIVDNIVSCLKSEDPFCFLKSDKESYLDYYKEIVIDVLKRNEKIQLLYFDPKFGDDLSAILNKELGDIDITLIGSSRLHGSRKILIIDNEKFSKRLDWELIDSLRLELSAANIGVFSISPNFPDDKLANKVSPIISKFNVFFLKKLKNNELKILKTQISERPNSEKLLSILDALLSDAPAKVSEGADASSGSNLSIWRKARDYIFKK